MSQKPLNSLKMLLLWCLRNFFPFSSLLSCSAERPVVDKIQSKSNYLNSLEKARMSYRMFHDFLVLAGHIMLAGVFRL